MALLMSSLEAAATAKLAAASKTKLDEDDLPTKRFDNFRSLSARYRAGSITPGDYFRLFQEIFGVQDSWVSGLVTLLS
jgi:hypothetical protein